jgi:Bacteriophage lambda head decoration protein D
MTAPLYFTPRVQAVALSEADGNLSRDVVPVTQSGAALASGTVLMNNAGVWSAYDGTHAAAGVLRASLPAATGVTKSVAYVRQAELNRNVLVGLDAAAVTALAALGLVVRGATGLYTIATPAL